MQMRMGAIFGIMLFVNLQVTGAGGNTVVNSNKLTRNPPRLGV